MNDFRAHGYALVSHVFHPDMVAAMNSALVGISDAAPAWRGPWIGPDEPATLITRHNIHLHQPWDAVIEYPVLLGAVAAVMGTTPMFDGSTLIAKPPATGQAFPLHQDAAYYGADDPAYVIATVLLDDATEENGSLMVVPGSHLMGTIPHMTEGASGRKYLSDVRGALTPVGGTAGDVVLMSHLTVHASPPNRSAAVRRTVRLGYRSRPRAD